VYPGSRQILIGSDSNVSELNRYDPISGITFTSPVSFGSGPQIFGDTSTGSPFGVGGNSFILLPSTYTSGSFMTGSTIYNGKTISSLGLTPGSYDWTWGSGSTFYKFTLEIVAPPTPTPTPTTTTTNTGTPTQTPTQTPTPSPIINVTITNSSVSGSTINSFFDSASYPGNLTFQYEQGSFPVTGGNTFLGYQNGTSNSPGINISTTLPSDCVLTITLNGTVILNSLYGGSQNVDVTLGGVPLLSSDVLIITMADPS
jgi:hypothetical protein